MTDQATGPRHSGMSPQDAAELFRRGPARFLDVGTDEIAYRKVGSGPDVLFVHGWPVSGATFRTLLPYLAEHITCHIIDLPGTGSSRLTARSPLTIENQIRSVRKVLDILDLQDVAVVGHDSGGMIARHAFAGDPRVRAFGLLDTEQSTGLSWKFKSFIAGRRIPGFGAALGWLVGKPRLRRNRLVLGDAFVDSSLLDGEFDEFFLKPITTSSEYRTATMRLLKSFDLQFIRELSALHKQIHVPVVLVWGKDDRFFPVKWAQEMAKEFTHGSIKVIANAGLFAHEERPAEVAAALLPVLVLPTIG